MQGRLRRGLVLWVKGAILAHNGGQDSTVVALERHGRDETLRRERRAWTYDDADRIVSWGPGTEVDAAAGFLERLRWVLALWTPGEGDSATETSLSLALDPTHPRDEWGALAVSVVSREPALPVAWPVVRADAPESGMAHFRRRLGLRAPAVPPGMPVHVLCDRGLDSRDLWARSRELGGHPVLRYAPHITFRPTGGDRVPVRSLGGGPGTFWVGAGEAFGEAPRARHADCAARPGWRGPLGPVDRHLRVLAVATRLAVAYGTRREPAADPRPVEAPDRGR